MRYFISEMNWENKTPDREEKKFTSLSFTSHGRKKTWREEKERRNYNFEKEISIFRASVAKNSVRNA